MNIINSVGVVINRFTAKEFTEGKHTLVFNGEHLSEGMYFCQLTIGSETQVIPIVLVR